MVAPNFLKNPVVREWLNGILPAWTSLDFESFVALRDERAALGGAIRLLENSTGAEFDGVMVRNTTILLQRAMEDGGIELTATGNLKRAVVADMIPRMEWPGFDKADMDRFNRVINENDFAAPHRPSRRARRRAVS